MMTCRASPESRNIALDGHDAGIDTTVGEFTLRQQVTLRRVDRVRCPEVAVNGKAPAIATR